MLSHSAALIYYCLSTTEMMGGDDEVVHERHRLFVQHGNLF